MRGKAGPDLSRRAVQARCDRWGFGLLGLSAEKLGSRARGVQTAWRNRAERKEMLCFEQGGSHGAFWVASSQVSVLCGPGLMPEVDLLT